MRKSKSNKFLILLTLILLLLIIGYFLVPFLNYGWLKKIYSPICSVIKTYQGEQYRPAWCLESNQVKKITPTEKINTNLNLNSNINSNLNTNQGVGIANPAAVKCIQDGGVSEPYKTAGGEAALCVFKDKSICEEWAYFRGECQVGKCFKECDQVGTGKEGWYNSCTKELLELNQCGQPAPLGAAINNITVSYPVSGQQLSSPIEISGRAKVSDNKVNIRIKSQTGNALINLSAPVKNIGTDGFGDFKISVKYEFSTTKEGYVEVYSLDQNNQEINIVSIPVKF
ncbi:MAG: DUF333 domain-containing protein [Candidatus Parcubacteria bacterium]|nr:DUF333 domain-containing protein [Candidatus Parcubacteria bacterium]